MTFYNNTSRLYILYQANFQTAFLATDEIHQLHRLRREGIPERLSRRYWLVCQRVAVVCLYSIYSLLVFCIYHRCVACLNNSSQLKHLL